MSSSSVYVEHERASRRLTNFRFLFCARGMHVYARARRKEILFLLRAEFLPSSFASSCAEHFCFVYERQYHASAFSVSLFLRRDCTRCMRAFETPRGKHAGMLEEDQEIVGTLFVVCNENDDG